MTNDQENVNPSRGREIFLAALEIDKPSERKTFLDGACGGDTPLRNHVESLLAAIDGATISKPVEDITELPTMPGSTPAGSAPGRWEPPPADEVSAMLDAYEVTDLLGRGGMGAVYKGVQSSLDRPVAIKLLPPELGSDAEFEARFRREAKSMARLNHPNIVQIYDFGEAAAGYHYIVMEFVDGADLQHLIRSGELDTEQALRAVGQICDALEYAHGEGYVHRDIKPANIFVDQKGNVKVGDFGLAKLVGDGGDHYLSGEIGLTQSGVAMGTPHYIAPEQLEKGAKVDRRADIYSLGVMFYEMLTGQIPRGSVRPPSQRVKQLDARVDGIVFRAMEHDPDERYQSATDLRKEVETIQLTKEDIAKAPEPKKKKTASPSTRKPAPATLSSSRSLKKPALFSIAATLLLLAAAGAYVAIQNSGSDENTGGDPAPKSPTVEGTAVVTPKSGDGSPEKPPAKPEVPPKSGLPSIPLAVPTRDFPDLATLPQGKVIIFGKRFEDNASSMGEIADISDFVEVRLAGGDGWTGLRANGDVIGWQYNHHRRPKIEGQDVHSLRRSSNSGYCLTSTGALVGWGGVNWVPFEGAPKSGIADIAHGYGRLNTEYTILKSDGSLVYFNVPNPLPAGIADFVRIEASKSEFFGIRESGELAFWGTKRFETEAVPGHRFVKLAYNGFQFMLALTVEGEVWQSFNGNALAPMDALNGEGPMIDIVCGNDIFAARRTDGTWFATSSQEPAFTLVEAINAFGPNVTSLSFFTGDIAVWIETEG